MAIIQDCLLRDFILRRVGNIHLDEKKMMDLKELLSDLMRGRNYFFLKGLYLTNSVEEIVVFVDLK